MKARSRGLEWEERVDGSEGWCSHPWGVPAFFLFESHIRLLSLVLVAVMLVVILFMLDIAAVGVPCIWLHNTPKKITNNPNVRRGSWRPLPRLLLSWLLFATTKGRRKKTTNNAYEGRKERRWGSGGRGQRKQSALSLTIVLTSFCASSSARASSSLIGMDAPPSSVGSSYDNNTTDDETETKTGRSGPVSGD